MKADNAEPADGSEARSPAEPIGLSEQVSFDGGQFQYHHPNATVFYNVAHFMAY